MRNIRGVLLGLVVAVVAAGCISVKSYVDPELPKVGYADLLARRDQRPVALSVAFHRNGKPASLGLSRVRDEVRTVVERSKLFSTVTDKPAGDVDQLDVVLDNVADVGDAIGKGMKTGATFGAAGSQVTDGYVFTVTFRPVGKPAVAKVYRHAIHTTVGRAEGPPGLTAMGISEAFSKVVEELVLNLLLDLQKEERL